MKLTNWSNTWHSVIAEHLEVSSTDKDLVEREKRVLFATKNLDYSDRMDEI